MKRGFGSPNYDKARQSAIASLGGKAAHQKRRGKRLCHEWTTAEASAAGRKGGIASGIAKRMKREAA